MSLLIEIRTAYFIAKLGTVSAAAAALGVHRATIMRRVDLLENELGRKVFRRHSKGYSLTDFGESLVRSAEMIENEAARFVGLCKLSDDNLEGELIIATPYGSAPTLVAVVQEFQNRFPNISVRHEAVTKIPRLEIGEAHICFFFGPRPEIADYVVIPWQSHRNKLYAHQSYIDRYGNPSALSDIPNHRFALLSEELFSLPNDWIREHVPKDNVVFFSNERQSVWRAVLEGLAIGSTSEHFSHQNPKIQPINLPIPNYESKTWMITHMDTHRSPKVTAFMNCLKDGGYLGKFDTDMDVKAMPEG
ncbi:MAG: LysR family transcriptional regulator [Pseudomonadota bacterium]